MSITEPLVIDVHGLYKSFNNIPAVMNVGLKIHRGEIFGFLGPNGSGKTTTIRMLCGLLVPDQASGSCLGFDVLTQAHQIKRRVGYMPQRFSLYEDLSVYENLEFVATLYELPNRDERIAYMMDYFQLTPRRRQLTGTLSGGWKQRVALAAALLHEPELLLLDEPTAGVDPKARREFWDTIHRLSRQGMTTLVSTHYMDEAERCHRLAYIAYGHLLTHGTMQSIIKEAELVTWQVEGNDLIELAEQLRLLKEVDQVTAFGNTLHVCGLNEASLSAALQPWQNDARYRWQKIRPGLEDIFIHLSAQARSQYEATPDE